MKQSYTLPELATFAHVSLRTVERAVQRGELQATGLDRKRFVLGKVAVPWLASRGIVLEPTSAGKHCPSCTCGAPPRLLPGEPGYLPPGMVRGAANVPSH